MSKQVIIRTFNEEGLNAFGEILTQLRAGVQVKISPELLFDDSKSEELENRIKIEKVDYVNKSELVKYLVEKLQLKKNKSLYFDKGMWTWLSAFYFDNICLGDKTGSRKVNESAFYVLNDPKNYTKYYRHLLAYPCRVYSEIGESAKIFLNGTFAKRGEITEQFGAYQEIALNKGIIDAANILYWDDVAGNIKKGAAGKNGGSARRLVRIIRQYQMTYDLNSMKGQEIVNMLPAEFNHWRH
jgi:hypothetical protein